MENLCRRDVVKIDLNKGLSRSYAGMVLATGDKMANCFGAALYRGNEAVDITGYAVTGYFIRNSGSETVVIAGKAEGNEAVVELPQACYSSDGGFSLAIKVSGADVTATVRVVDGTIRLTQTGVTIDPGEVIPSLDELFAQIAAMEQATDAAVGAAEFANASGEQAYLLAQQATVNLTTQVNERLRQIAPPIINTATGDGVVLVSDSSESTFERLSIFGRTTQIGTPSPENPVEMVNIGTKGNILITAAGGSLIDLDKRSPDTFVAYVNGTTGEFAGCTATDFIPVAGPTISIYAKGDSLISGAGLCFYGADKTFVSGVRYGDYFMQDGAFRTVTIPIPEEACYFRASLASSSIAQSRISLGNAIPEGAENNALNSLNFIPPDEMRGIPVSSGGNYTDETGQQWLCDEIDLARGVYVQRVRMAEAGSFSWTINPTWTESNPSATLAYARITGLKHGTCLSTSFVNRVFTTAPTYWNSGEMATQADGVLYAAIPKLDNPTNEGFAEYLSDCGVWILYQLAEPIETPLPDDIMSAAMALKSLYPNTTIINDEGAGMAAGYVADTKTYIDQRIAALLNA